MSVVIRFPDFARYMNREKSSFSVQATTVRQAFENIETLYPEVNNALFRGAKEMRGAVIYVNEEDVRLLQKLDTPLKDGDEVMVLFAIPGG